jgi:hypothetical protein
MFAIARTRKRRRTGVATGRSVTWQGRRVGGTSDADRSLKGRQRLEVLLDVREAARAAPE